MKNNINSELSIIHSDDKPAKSIVGTDIAVAVDTINDFPLDASDGDTVIVRDLDRGGTFIYDSTKVAGHNDGTNFNGWIRQYSGAVNVKWFGAVGDGVTDDTASIQLAVSISKNILIPSGSYILSSPISYSTGQRIRGEGRRNSVELIMNSTTNNMFEPLGNSRDTILSDMLLKANTTSSGSALYVDPALGIAESQFNNIDTQGFSTTISAGDLYWNNSHTGGRWFTDTGVSITGTVGSSISNKFDKIYFDNSGGNNTLSVNLDNSSTATFINCNFGGSPTSGMFVKTIGSAYGIKFINCNFEVQAVSSSAFGHFVRSKVTYDGCTFINISESIVGLSMMQLQGPDVEVGVSNCTIVNNSVSTTNYFLVQGSRLNIENSISLYNINKIVYEANSGVFPKKVEHIGSSKSSKEIIELYGYNNSSNIVTREIINTSYLSNGSLHTILTFTHGTPASSSDSASVSGRLNISFSGRNDGGARISCGTSFIVTYDNDGDATITQEYFHANSGSRVVSSATLTQNLNTLELTLATNNGSISGGTISAIFDYTKSSYGTFPINASFS